MSQVPLIRSKHWLLSCLLGLCACGTNSPTSSPCLPGNHSGSQKACAPFEVHHIPFKPGYKTQITQGYHGEYSHVEEQAYAVDFACNEGEPIVASRAGIVWDIREDSKVGCLDAKCLGFDNYVVLDHGDGTRTGYHHLKHRGALVKVGERVCKGELIGICGSSGYSGSAHLHWTLNDLFDRSIPAQLAEAKTPGNIAIPYKVYTSSNLRANSCEEVSNSALPPNGLLHHGIELDAPLKNQYVRTAPSTKIKGRYHGPLLKVALSRRKRYQLGVWDTICVPVKPDKSFEIPLDWSTFTPGFYFMMINGSGEDCNPPGWQLSFPVRLDASVDQKTESFIRDQSQPGKEAEGSGKTSRETLKVPKQ